MDFLELTEANFDELLFDMNELNQAFHKKETQFSSDFNVQKNLGYFHVNSSKKGNVYVAQCQSRFTKNILAKGSLGMNNIALYFVKKGRSAFNVNLKKKELKLQTSNSHTTVFMNEGHKGWGGYLKDEELVVTSLHLPIPYFENLVHLYPELFETSFLRYQKGESFYLKDHFATTTPEMHHLVAQIENSALFGTGQRAYVDAKILELLTLQFQYHTTKQKDYCAKEETKIREAAYLLKQNLDHPPSLRDLSLQIGLNEKKVKQGFHAVFNTTAYGYLFDYKMKLAQQLLLDSDQSIYEIGLACGYEHASHFSTAFKRKFGCSPKKFRQHAKI